MSWLLSVFVVSVGTGIAPVFSSEIYLVGVMVSHPELPWWLAGSVAAVGQLLGKSVHYLAARGVVELPRVLPRSGRVTGRWSRWSQRFQGACVQRPVRSAGVVLLSAVFGLPPFALVVVTSGLARLPLMVVVPPGVAGRVFRYCLLAALPGLAQHWWW